MSSLRRKFVKAEGRNQRAERCIANQRTLFGECLVVPSRIDPASFFRSGIDALSILLAALLGKGQRFIPCCDFTGGLSFLNQAQQPADFRAWSHVECVHQIPPGQQGRRSNRAIDSGQQAVFNRFVETISKSYSVPDWLATRRRNRTIPQAASPWMRPTERRAA